MTVQCCARCGCAVDILHRPDSGRPIRAYRIMGQISIDSPMGNSSCPSWELYDRERYFCVKCWNTAVQPKLVAFMEATEGSLR